ncbi:hypothetical protein T07_10133 [Trichinella nelsoni]|uniref:Uncharacterized protein n=1 Tax=Trichinella nelsoni TaxID=6336 RepID=A0A0V0RQH2_9BILA|nr:hypothetical protein T07_10133 [Trichinella nelsoni]
MGQLYHSYYMEHGVVGKGLSVNGCWKCGWAVYHRECIVMDSEKSGIDGRVIGVKIGGGAHLFRYVLEASGRGFYSDHTVEIYGELMFYTELLLEWCESGVSILLPDGRSSTKRPQCECKLALGLLRDGLGAVGNGRLNDWCRHWICGSQLWVGDVGVGDVESTPTGRKYGDQVYNTELPLEDKLSAGVQQLMGDGQGAAGNSRPNDWCPQWQLCPLHWVGCGVVGGQDSTLIMRWKCVVQIYNNEVQLYGLAMGFTNMNGWLNEWYKDWRCGSQHRVGCGGVLGGY